MSNAVEDSSCGVIEIDPNSTSLRDHDYKSIRSHLNVNKIGGLSDALIRIYSERRKIFKEEEVFGIKDESKFLMNNVLEMESSYKKLKPKFGFENIYAKSILLTESANQTLQFLDLSREMNIDKEKNLREISKIENDFDSEIFVKMPPVKKFTKKAKIRRVTKAVPHFILEED